jgi:ABC-type phosphate transport system substrate-binding protein
MKTLRISFLMTFLLFLATSGAGAAEIAVIVNHDNPIDRIRLGDLVKIFKMERKYWENGEKIYLILRDTGSKEKDIALKMIYKTTDEGLRKYWLARLYREEITSFPKALNSNEAVIRFVNQVPNSIGFIDASFLDNRVKALRIDGHIPGEQGYPLRGD